MFIMNIQLAPGDFVLWKWAGSIAHGEDMEVVRGRVEIVSGGKRIVRNGSVDNPAVIIRHASGNDVLKLASELHKAASES